jgi:hypothetical protein
MIPAFLAREHYSRVRPLRRAGAGRAGRRPAQAVSIRAKLCLETAPRRTKQLSRCSGDLCRHAHLIMPTTSIARCAQRWSFSGAAPRSPNDRSVSWELQRALRSRTILIQLSRDLKRVKPERRSTHARSSSGASARPKFAPCANSPRGCSPQSTCQEYHTYERHPEDHQTWSTILISQTSARQCG